MLKDKIILGILVGLLADAVKLTFNFIGFRLNFTPVVFWQLISALFLEKEDVFTPAGILIGGIADIIVAGFLGVIFIYVIYFTGKENLWIKGIGFGLLVWVSLFGLLLGQLVHDKVPLEPSGILITIAAHFLYGLSLAVFTKLLAGNLTFFIEDVKKFQQEKSFKLSTSLQKSKISFKKPKKI
ncbi:MAG: hypothetical protein KGZ63_14330 [Clostridiales bacterium]|jgi:hypothetical protein|nr:hypothetical protein [Clostridiales bacterium]